MDPDLLNFLESKSTALASVIIHVKDQQLVKAKIFNKPGAIKVVELLSVDKALQLKSMDKFAAFLSNLKIKNFNRINSARSFVMDVTPQQLKSILKSDLIQSTSFNHEHKIHCF